MPCCGCQALTREGSLAPRKCATTVQLSSSCAIPRARENLLAERPGCDPAATRRPCLVHCPPSFLKGHASFQISGKAWTLAHTVLGIAAAG